MKAIVLLCLVAAAMAAPPVSSGSSQVLRYENENAGTGSFRYAYEQDDGIKGEAVGDFHPGTGKDGEGAFVAFKGSFEWVGPDGVTYTGTYVADENGYRPQYNQGPNGAIPDEVLKNLPSRK